MSARRAWTEVEEGGMSAGSENVNAELKRLQDENEKLRGFLAIIADPKTWLRDKGDLEGKRPSEQKIRRLAKDAAWLGEVARIALGWK